MDPVICLVSPGAVQRTAMDGFLARMRAAAQAGVHLLQIRERALDGGELFELVRSTVTAVEGTAARVVVNDRLDVALAAGAHGVHLRAGSLPAVRARSMAPRGFLIGRSVHSLAAARDADSAGGLDYLMFGTVFESASKPGRAAAGVQALAEVASATTLPVLAVGGIGLEQVGGVARSGAAGFAAIRLFDDVPPVRLAGLAADAREAWSRGRRS